MKRKDLWSIPNMISYVRILLMPVYVYLSFQKQYVTSSYLLLFLATTDFLDGFIARKYNMVTDFGKFLDPLADKLFQLAIAITLLSRIEGMWIVFVVFMVKEWSLFLFAAYLYLKYKKAMDGAIWCGKLSTAVFYLMTFIMALFPPLPTKIYFIMEACMLVTLLISFFVYGSCHYKLYKSTQN